MNNLSEFAGRVLPPEAESPARSSGLSSPGPQLSEESKVPASAEPMAGRQSPKSKVGNGASLEQRVAELEKEVALLKAQRADLRRLTIPKFAHELGISVREVKDLISANILPVCNATSRPRIPVEDAVRILRERFERKAA